ncbi:Fatty acid cis/trans isomerase [hydrothermal vent metagenome]|uniref:Fatty acid cis/trans isomerase n=1 Tax=hydrothermal vent metagenome TaxID=652676 RepID=A0A3B0ZZQ1_9ZZZZ
MEWLKKSNNIRAFVIFFVVLLLAALAYNVSEVSRIAANERKTIELELASLPLDSPVSYQQQVKPVLERRCIVCHGCYDAPCQLKLSSIEGLQRGASEVRIYEPRRIESIPPSRLFVDAKNTQQWRSRGFYPVINEATQNPIDNLQNSILYRLLQLKKQYPQPNVNKLPDSFTLELNRKQTCPKPDTINKFVKKHPLWGMPYAMPNLATEEYQTLVSWIAQGSRVEPPAKPSAAVQTQITQWETFLNQPSNKQKLVSRYLYEHLFHAHIHFAGSAEREFYRLVRSRTQAGKAIDEIATLRPNDSPGERPFYYRLLPYHSSIVNKNHIVYQFSNKRMQRFRKLFLTPDYNVSRLPSYERGEGSNPFKIYAAIPAVSRYRFMLDDAHFFIEGFIKGPVCRGQLALNVIEDQFWVVFFNPDKPMITNNSEFIEKMANELQVPEDFDNNFDLLRIWTDYWKGQLRYMEGKQAWFKTIGTHELEHAMDYIWDGDGNNPNAALTVFRHFDSGSVAYGLVGSNPETTWVIDFPLLERIHYLLVADFNIYGNIGHRMSTRIYMDFLRMEGEDSFLAFLPVNKRKAIRDKWYVGQRSSIEKLFSAPQEWLNTESVKGYQTNDPQRELYQIIKERLKHLKQHANAINHCGSPGCKNISVESTVKRAAIKRVDNAMIKIAKLQGEQLHSFPDVAFVRVKASNAEDDLTYSLIRNKAYKNVTSFLADAHERDRADVDRDTMTVVKWLEGSYPNFFFSVDLSEIEIFSKRCAAIRTDKDYERFVDQYGVRRTNPLFWELADWFQDNVRQKKPILSGLFDLNRYQNR